MDIELARLVDGWPTLPEPIRRAIAALVGTVTATAAAPAAPAAGKR